MCGVRGQSMRSPFPDDDDAATPPTDAVTFVLQLLACVVVAITLISVVTLIARYMLAKWRE